MINLVKGNLLKSQAQALVNTVNTMGVMGKGIALQFKNAFPDNNSAYVAACEKGLVVPGKVFTFVHAGLAGGKTIFNFPTKRHWKDNSRIDDIVAGLNDLVDQIEQRGIKTVAVPPLGCGFGGLSWKTVLPLIEEALGPLQDVVAEVYEPAGSPAAEDMVHNEKRPGMTPGRAAVLLAMHQYLATGWEYRLSLLEVQKLAYFLQEFGLKLNMRFKPAIYGPYADEMRHVMNRMEGHFTVGFADGRNSPDTPIQVMPDAVTEAEAFEEKHLELREYINRVSKFIENFETPFGMELLSSVHWLAVHGRNGVVANDNVQATQMLKVWNHRKARTFNADHVALAWDRLAENGLLHH